MICRRQMLIGTVLAVALLAGSARAAPDPRFTAFIASLWPEAQQAGVSRATVDAATRGLEPNYRLPDLALPGRAPSTAPQAEFVQVPGEYVREAGIARLAEHCQSLRQQDREGVDGIAQQSGRHPSR